MLIYPEPVSVRRGFAQPYNDLGVKELGLFGKGLLFREDHELWIDNVSPTVRQIRGLRNAIPIRSLLMESIVELPPPGRPVRPNYVVL